MLRAAHLDFIKPELPTFKAAAELWLESIASHASSERLSQRSIAVMAQDQEHGGERVRAPEIDDSGIPWVLLARKRDGELEFAGPAILRPLSLAKDEWAEKFVAMATERPALKELRQGSAQWLRPELRVRVRHLKAKGPMRHPW